MADVKIATGEEQPINRFAAESSEVVEEGDFVALEDVDGDGEPEVVQADVTNGRPAVGVAIKTIEDPSTMSDELDGLAKDIVRTEHDVVGDRVAYVRYGVEVEDQDASFGDYQGSYGEPVYLVQGKGLDVTYTTDESQLGSGDVRQVVGYTVEDRRVALDVDADYDTVA
jgi:hypothetical protein